MIALLCALAFGYGVGYGATLIFCAIGAGDLDTVSARWAWLTIAACVAWPVVLWLGWKRHQRDAGSAVGARRPPRGP